MLLLGSGGRLNALVKRLIFKAIKVEVPKMLAEILKAQRVRDVYKRQAFGLRGRAGRLP